MKYIGATDTQLSDGRSREGAWIEIMQSAHMIRTCLGRSREGAWIEIIGSITFGINFIRRSREGAWIEM